MPTYDYVCDACQHEFELFQSITESPKRKCPSCGRRKLHRLIGPGAAIMFKGSGFYSTDYRSESYKKAAAAETPSGNGNARGSNGKAAEASGKTAVDSGKKAEGASKSKAKAAADS
jgi:putative FmdB family regulatory protein